MPVISFASSKGGAGKTTSCIVLGTELAEGIGVTMIDADPAGRLAHWGGLATLPRNLHFSRSGGERHIQDEIAEARRRTPFVLVDLEGSASRLTSFVVAESDLVVVPMGEEQQDADAAIETLGEVVREGRACRRDIPAVVLFARTNAAVKSKLERFIAAEMRRSVRVLDVELHRRTAFSALHNSGAGLRQLDPGEVNGIDKAIQNASAFAAAIVDVLEEGRPHAAVA